MVLIFFKWSYRSEPQLLLTIELRVIIKFWVHSPISFEHMFLGIHSRSHCKAHTTKKYKCSIKRNNWIRHVYLMSLGILFCKTKVYAIKIAGRGMFAPFSLTISSTLICLLWCHGKYKKIWGVITYRMLEIHGIIFENDMAMGSRLW